MLNVIFDAMGRSFSSNEEVQTFFRILVKHATGHGDEFKIYHVRSLFYLLSLREDAPHLISRDDARDCVRLTLERLKRLVQRQKYSAVMRTCIRALGGLTRVRLAQPDFLNPDHGFGERARDTLRTIIERSEGRPARATIGQLAAQVLEVIEERGASSTILNWDGNDDSDGDEED